MLQIIAFIIIFIGIGLENWWIVAIGWMAERVVDDISKASRK